MGKTNSIDSGPDLLCSLGRRSTGDVRCTVSARAESIRLADHRAAIHGDRKAPSIREKESSHASFSPVLVRKKF